MEFGLEGRIMLAHPRRTDEAFRYQVEGSPDLEHWEDLAAESALADDQAGRPPGTERVEVGVPVESGQAK